MSKSELSEKSRASSKERAKNFFEMATRKFRKTQRRKSEGDSGDPESVVKQWEYNRAAESMEKRLADQGYEELGSVSTSEEELEIKDPTFSKRYSFGGVGDASFRQYVVGINRDTNGDFIYELFTGEGTVRHLKMRDITKEAMLDFLTEMELNQVEFPEKEYRVLEDPTNPRFTELTSCGDRNCECCESPRQGDLFCTVGEPSHSRWNPDEESEDEERSWKKDKKGGKKSKDRPLPSIPVGKHKDRKKIRKNKNKEEERYKQEHNLMEKDKELIAEAVRKEWERRKAMERRKKSEKKWQKQQRAGERAKKKGFQRWANPTSPSPSESPSSSSESESDDSRFKNPKKIKGRKAKNEDLDDHGYSEYKVNSNSYSQGYERTEESIPDTNFWKGVIEEVLETSPTIPRVTKSNSGTIRVQHYRIVNSLKELQSGSAADVVKRLHKAAVILVQNGVWHKLLPRLFVDFCLSNQDKTLGDSCSDQWESKPVENLIKFLENRVMKSGGEQLQRAAANEYVQTQFQNKNVNVNLIASQLKAVIAPRLCAAMAGFSDLETVLKKDRISTTARDLFVNGLKIYKPQIYNKALSMSLLESPDVLKLAEQIQNLFLVQDTESINTVWLDKIDKQLVDVSRKLEINSNRARGRGRARGAFMRRGRGSRSRGRSRGRNSSDTGRSSQLAVGYQGEDIQTGCFYCGENHRPQECAGLKEIQGCYRCGDTTHFASQCTMRGSENWSRGQRVGRGFGGRREPAPCKSCKEQGLRTEDCKAKSIHCFQCGGNYPCATHSKSK